MRSDPPDGWQALPVDAIADVVGGGTPSTKDPANFGGEIAWLTPKDLGGARSRWIAGGERTITAQGLASSSARLLPERTVLVSSRAPVGYVALAANELATNQGFRSLVVRPPNVPEYVYYVMTTMKPALEAAASGTTFQEISGSALKRIELPVPPPDEQHRIAAVLGALDEQIDSNERLAATLAECATTLVRQAVAGADARPLADVATVTYGAPFSSQLFGEPGDGLPLLRIRDLKTQEPGVWTTEQRAGARLVQPGDVVVGMDGEFRAHLWSGSPAWLNQRVCAFDPRPGVSRAYLLDAIKQPLAFFESTKGGTTVIHLGKRDIDTFTVPHLSDAAMRELVENVDPLLAKSVALLRERATLRAIRDELVPKLVSGRLRVPGGEERAA